MLEKWVDVVALSHKICRAPILGDLKYATHDNFLGRPVLGYRSDARDVCLMTREASLALCDVQDELAHDFSLGLIIYDSYRPLRAVRDFLQWITQAPVNDLELEKKQIHYPDLDKANLAKMGYLALNVSRHCFGNTVDVGLVSLNDQTQINMGTVFDFFGKASHVTASPDQIGEIAFKNRKLLVDVMWRQGFSVYDEEYWHFDHKTREVNEPQDFEITSDLKYLGTQITR
jgi:D-alanyl-D-alanine dipeptidase